MLEFGEQLFRFGVLTAQVWRPTSPADQPAVLALIRQADQMARLDAPATAPPLDENAAHWGLSVLAWSVSLLVDRANVSTWLPQVLVGQEPSAQSASHHWSVDLTLRYFGEVLLRAKSAAPDDALVPELTNIAARWPLASVGTQLSWNAERGSIILNDPCLRRVLLDRIVLRRDKVLAEDPALQGYIEALARPPE